MKLFITLLLSAILFTLTNCETNSHSNNFRDEFTEGSPEPEIEKSPEELRAELKASEENSPEKYLSCGEVRMSPQQVQTRSAGLFHDAEYEPDGAIFRGTINSSATLGRFKDPKIKILFYSRTNTLIEEQSYVIYEYIEPRSTTSFSFKTESYPQAYENFRVQLVGASVAE
ncbi:MAG: hypothetical protein K0S23_629 [Fluviicola sp.]|jgi:hypothetical protein|uniref:hypothetical protein n=1 Tax=Fluviicola sp. TaxID=1917219 RepID=UPI002634F06F|nr:hypothetical protein [Fluviicola sp.]MDF3026322.1 hypothetical protein [Fluviicola sp.]